MAQKNKVVVSNSQGTDNDGLLDQLLREGNKSTPADITLKQLIKSCPYKSLAATEEDRAWMNMKPAGKEIL